MLVGWREATAPSGLGVRFVLAAAAAAAAALGLSERAATPSGVNSSKPAWWLIKHIASARLLQSTRGRVRVRVRFRAVPGDD